MSRGEVLAGKAVVEFGIRNRIAAGMKSVESDLNALGNKIGGLGAVISASASGLLAAPLMAASRMQETVSKFNQLFGDSAAEVSDWSKTTARAIGVPEESMLAMLASTQSLLVPMGVLPASANEMSKSLSQLAVDLGSFNNMNSADVFRDLMAAMTGESEPMKKYGVIVNETAVKQELLNMALDPKTANDAAKAQARMNIIMRGTVAAQGDAIRTSDSFANQLKALWSSIMDTSTALGTNLVQDIADLIEVAVSGVYAVRDFAERNRDLVRAFGVVTTAAAGVGASMVATGVALKVAAVGMSVLGVASQAAAMVAGVAWSGLSLVFTALTIKSRITSAIIRTGWTVAAAAIGVAWTALKGALSITMQGLIAVATVSAIVAPWLAGAATIAVAWFGLDTVMATLALGAAAAWSASAGTVTTAWTVAAGVLVPLATAISAAYAASATFVTTAFLSLQAAFASSGAVGVAWAIASGAAWLAYGLIVQAIAIKQAIDAAIVSAAWSVASAVASAAWTGFGAVLAAISSPAALAAAAAGIVSGAWAAGALVASTAWATAWAIITSPILPIVAAIGGLVVVMGGITAAAGYAAIAGANFGAAWDIVAKTFGQLVSIVNTTFDAIKDALGSGDYAAATQALWLGIQAGFWVGVEATLNAFHWLWDEAWAATKRFFSGLLDYTWRVMKTIAKAIVSPVQAAKEMGTLIGELVGSAQNFDVSGKVSDSQKALKDIRDQIAATKARNDAEKEAQKIREESMTAEERRNAKLKEISDLERTGALSKEDADKARAKVEADEPTVNAAEVDNAFKDKVKDLELEILALEQGEKAAERKRLADQGLNEQQIKDVEALQAKKKALEDMKAAQDAAMQKRTEGIFQRADELGEQGVAPAEIFNRVMAQIDADQKDGRLDKGAADEARGRAQDDLQGRMDNLKQEGQALAEALRTPGEKLAAEIARINQLQAAGAIDEKTAKRAEAKAQEDFAATQAKQVDDNIEQAKALGPTGTFSGFAVGSGAFNGGQDIPKQQLLTAKAMEKRLAIIAKNTAKREVARAG
jgi:hypothetical protein